MAQQLLEHMNKHERDDHIKFQENGHDTMSSVKKDLHPSPLLCMLHSKSSIRTKSSII